MEFNVESFDVLNMKEMKKNIFLHLMENSFDEGDNLDMTSW